MKLAIAIASTFILLLLSISIFHPTRHLGFPESLVIQKAQTKHFPQKVWQTWQGSKKLEDEPLRFARTWIESNSGFGYELLTDETAREYITSRFPTQPDVLETWDRIADYILRADFIRYLTLLGDGGVYTDIDTDCTKPIKDWLSAEQQAAADVVVGLEYDSRLGQTSADMDDDVQFCTWTIMAKPRSYHLQNVVDQVHENLRSAVDNMDDHSIRALNVTEVLRLTGPRGFTSAMLHSMTMQMGQSVTAANLTMIEEPTLFGTVLVMPISSFASGQSHSGSKPWGNEQQLLSHHWSGFKTWKPDYSET